MSRKRSPKERKAMFANMGRRTPQALNRDNSIRAANTLPDTPANRDIWAANPRRIDIEGLDTPIKKIKQKEDMDADTIIKIYDAGDYHLLSKEDFIYADKLHEVAQSVKRISPTSRAAKDRQQEYARKNYNPEVAGKVYDMHIEGQKERGTKSLTTKDHIQAGIDGKKYALSTVDDVNRPDRGEYIDAMKQAYSFTKVGDEKVGFAEYKKAMAIARPTEKIGMDDYDRFKKDIVHNKRLKEQMHTDFQEKHDSKLPNETNEQLIAAYTDKNKKKVFSDKYLKDVEQTLQYRGYEFEHGKIKGNIHDEKQSSVQQIYQKGKDDVPYKIDGQVVNDYSRTIHGVSDVLKEKGVDASPNYLSREWHDPLVSISPKHDVEMVRKSIEGTFERDLKGGIPYKVESGANPKPGYTHSDLLNASQYNSPSKLKDAKQRWQERYQKDIIPGLNTANEFTKKLDKKTKVVNALSPNSETITTARKMSTKIKGDVQSTKDYWNKHINDFDKRIIEVEKGTKRLTIEDLPDDKDKQTRTPSREKTIERTKDLNTVNKDTFDVSVGKDKVWVEYDTKYDPELVGKKNLKTGNKPIDEAYGDGMKLKNPKEPPNYRDDGKGINFSIKGKTPNKQIIQVQKEIENRHENEVYKGIKRDIEKKRKK